jgi:hypothetical protein
VRDRFLWDQRGEQFELKARSSDNGFGSLRGETGAHRAWCSPDGRCSLISAVSLATSGVGASLGANPARAATYAWSVSNAASCRAAVSAASFPEILPRTVSAAGNSEIQAALGTLAGAVFDTSAANGCARALAR